MGQMEVYVEYFVNLLFTLGTYVHCYICKINFKFFEIYMQQKLSFSKSPSLCKQFFLKFRYSEKATKF